MIKREIYSIAFNKTITDKGEVRMYTYTLDHVSLNELRTPKKITTKDDKVIVEFTDGTRHIIPLAGVEIFDRIVKPKPIKHANK